jgi:hypothetical protein
MWVLYTCTWIPHMCEDYVGVVGFGDLFPYKC